MLCFYFLGHRVLGINSWSSNLSVFSVVLLLMKFLFCKSCWGLYYKAGGEGSVFFEERKLIKKQINVPWLPGWRAEPSCRYRVSQSKFCVCVCVCVALGNLLQWQRGDKNQLLSVAAPSSSCFINAFLESFFMPFFFLLDIMPVSWISDYL